MTPPRSHSRSSVSGCNTQHREGTRKRTPLPKLCYSTPKMYCPQHHEVVSVAEGSPMLWTTPSKTSTKPGSLERVRRSNRARDRKRPEEVHNLSTQAHSCQIVVPALWCERQRPQRHQRASFPPGNDTEGATEPFDPTSLLQRVVPTLWCERQRLQRHQRASFPPGNDTEGATEPFDPTSLLQRVVPTLWCERQRLRRHQRASCPPGNDTEGATEPFDPTSLLQRVVPTLWCERQRLQRRQHAGQTR
jgi:hypothetical protein